MYRKGSKKEQLHTAYKSGGEAAALQLGQSLSIKETRIKRLVRQWSNSVVVAAGARKRVRMGTFEGLIVEEGDQQSIVRWDDGQEQCVANEWIQPIKE